MTKVNNIIIDKLIANGRVEITSNKELQKYPVVSLISYEDADRNFIDGGFITKLSEDFFILM